MFPLIMHINFCEQGQSLEDACQLAADWGFDGVEFRRKRTGVEESITTYLDTIAKATERAGLEHIVFGGPGPNLMQPDPSARAMELDTMRELYEQAARRFQLTVCNTMTGPLLNSDQTVTHRDYEKHGSAIATPAQWNAAVDGFKELGAMAATLGFRFAFETHPNFLHDLPQPSLELVQRIGSAQVGLNLDYGNIIHFKEHPSLEATLELIADKLFYVHVKNYGRLHFSGDLFPTSLADGLINHREFIRLLQHHNYQGPLCVEAPRPGDRERFAEEDCSYAKTLLATLAGT